MPVECTAFRLTYNHIDGPLMYRNTSSFNLEKVLEQLSNTSHIVEIIREVEPSIFILLPNANYAYLPAISIEIFGKNCTIYNSSFCFLKSMESVLWVEGTTKALGGSFSLEYTMSISKAKNGKQKCTEKTEQISAYATETDVKNSLEKLIAVDDVIVTLTDAMMLKEKKIQLGRIFHIHFQRVNSRYCQINDVIQNQNFKDLHLLEIDGSLLTGTPTRDSTNSDDYQARVFEVVKGLSQNLGGSIAVDVSSRIIVMI